MSTILLITLAGLTFGILVVVMLILVEIKRLKMDLLPHVVEMNAYLQAGPSIVKTAPSRVAFGGEEWWRRPQRGGGGW